MARYYTRPIAASLLFVAVFASTLVTFDTDSASASDPRLRLRPNDGPPGTVTLARGRHFAALSTGTVNWEDGTVLAEFVADEEGSFEVEITIPVSSTGAVEVAGLSGDQVASDTFEVEGGRNSTAGESTTSDSTTIPSVSTSGVGERDGTPGSDISSGGCPSEYARLVNVTNAVELESALASAQPADQIVLADGTYAGNFVAERSGRAGAGISLCGTRNAVIDGGDIRNGYALHLTGDYWTIHGITVTNALKGIMLDGANFNLLDQVAVHAIGHEAVHFRTNSSDNVIRDSQIYDTGLKKEKFGEGIYLGSAVSNWGRYTNGEPDRSDRNQVLHNQIWNTTAENIDIKEGTSGGVVEGNVLDGSMLSGADSWVDVKGSAYIIRSNTGMNSPTDGFQTHVINDMEWGRDNLFEENHAEVNGDGFGFYIHNPDEFNNTVRCSNHVSGAESGFANVACS